MHRISSYSVFILILFLTACGGGGDSGGGSSRTVSTPQGNIGISLWGGTFAQEPTTQQNVQPPSGTNILYTPIAFTAVVGNPGESLTVTLTFPNPIPQGSVLMKYLNGNWANISGAQVNVGGNTVTYAVQDGGPLDGDGQANGIVVDPVALLVPSPDGGGGGGETEPSSWTIRNMNDGLVGLAYANGIYVAVTDYHAFFYSRDGIKWTPKGGVSDAGALPIYGNGIFLVPRRASDFYYLSQDGISWDLLEGEGNGPILYYTGAERYFVRGGGSSVYRSFDGRTWEEFAQAPTENFELLSPEVLYSNILVGRGTGGYFYSLYGGSDWIPLGISSSRDFLGVWGNLLLVVGNPVYYVVLHELTSDGPQHTGSVNIGCSIRSSGGSLVLPLGFLVETECGTYFSPDGRLWRKIADKWFGAATQGPGTQVVLGNSMADIWLWDGVSTLRKVGFQYDWGPVGSIQFLGGEFLGVTSEQKGGGHQWLLHRSNDGTTWSTEVAPPILQGGSLTLHFAQAEGRIYALAGRRIVDVGGNRLVWEDSDPYTLYYALAYGNGRFVAVGSNGYVATGTSSGGWQKLQAAPGKKLLAVEYIHELGEFWALGQEGTALRSTDGVSWEMVQIFNLSSTFYDIAYGNGVLVISGGSLLVSHDRGRTWYIPPYTRSPHSRAVTFGGGYFVSVGGFGEIAYSRDGRNWSLARVLEADSYNQFYNFSDLADIVYSNGLFVAVGSRGAIITSP